MQHLRLRTIVIAAVGSAVISLSSMYVALRMGALPWPTIFVAIVSLAILKAFKNSNLNEVNVAHTGMSAGAMVAGGIAFTIPGIWMIDKNASVNFFYVFIVALIGTALGVIAVALLREYFIEKSNLPYPVGVATAQTLVAGDEGGKKSKIVFSSLGISAIFTVLRDGFAKIPQAILIKGLESYGIGFFMSPMALGVGYIIGIINMGVWFLGSVVGNFFILKYYTSYLISYKAMEFEKALERATYFKRDLSFGIIIGGGIALLIKDIIPKLKPIISNALKKLTFSYKTIVITLAVILVVEIAFLKLSVLASILTIVGALVTIIMAAYVDGATGVVPMEIFGIIVLLFVKIVSFGVNFTYLALFAIAAIVAVATGITGDNLQDFKAGSILKTNPNAQIVSEAVGGIVGCIFGTLGLFVLHSAYGVMGPNTFMPATQASMVAQLIKGFSEPRAFFFGLIIGLFLYFLKVPSIILGIGIYLPFPLAGTAIIGSLIRVIVDKFHPKSSEDLTLVSSGLLGGEGFAGMVIAIIRFIWRL